MAETLKNASRKSWTGPSNVESINAGSLQRIADATDKMAARHTELISQRDSYERSATFWQDAAD